MVVKVSLNDVYTTQTSPPRTSHCYSITYELPEGQIMQANVAVVHSRIEAAATELLGVEVRWIATVVVEWLRVKSGLARELKIDLARVRVRISISMVRVRVVMVRNRVRVSSGLQLARSRLDRILDATEWLSVHCQCCAWSIVQDSWHHSCHCQCP